MDKLFEAIISTVWDKACFERHQHGKLPHDLLKPYTGNIQALSDRYVNPKRSSSPKIEKNDAIAYVLYYLPINYFKIKELLATVSQKAPEQVLKVLDVGAGPATASLAAIDYFGDISKLDLTLIEPNPHMQYQASNLLEYYGAKNEQFQFLNIDELDQGEQFDLMFFGNVLNECSEHQQARYSELIGQQLSSLGSALIIEPALKHTTRQLMKFRNALLQKHSKLSIAFPCFRNDNCPMLEANDHDWCHSEYRWERPTLIAQLDELTDFNKHKLKSSSMIFTREQLSSELLRVVSIPKQSKLGVEFTVCGQSKYLHILAPKKTAAAKSIKKAKMHDAISIEPAPPERLGPEHNIVIS